VRGEVDVLVTQMYFEGQPENDKDWFLQSIPAAGRSRLTVKLLPPPPELEADSQLAVFDIVLSSA
jgi:protocatechuate 3,4-dioxygenase, beta subunit